MTNISLLYVSCLCSDLYMRRLFDSADDKPHSAPQKFHSLLVKGLVENGQSVTCLVARPVTIKTHPHKKWWKLEQEIVDGVKYVYMPFYNHPIPKLLGYKIYAFFYTLVWAWHTRGEKAMICDVLNAQASASMKASRLFGVKCAGIVTDIPGYMDFSNKKKSFIKRLAQNKAIRNIKRMTHLVPLTEAMCDIINPDRKTPYIVVEGLVDSSMEEQTPIVVNDGKRHLTYTGSLHEVFGVKSLIEGFMMLRKDDVILDIYGQGPMKDEMDTYMAKDPRVQYHGVVSLEESVKAQLSSCLLINPRPTGEEFTKYSFPSKNMEYMATGVPLLTTVLPGMPKEYHPYVFLLEDESAEGICKRLDEILSMPQEKLQERGQMGKDFVMKNKNNIRQAERVMELLNDF